jgi:hypothetical protein
MTKSSVPFWAMALMVFASLIYRLKKASKNLAPMGYEDDDGFHFDEPE